MMAPHGVRGGVVGGLLLGELTRELRTSSVVVGDDTVRITGVRHDSRDVLPGDLFVVRRGEHADGSKFVRDAAARGSVALMAARSDERFDSAGLPIVLVDDLPAAMAFGAAAVYGHPGFALDVIGVTGTNGKTTVTHLVRGALDTAEGAHLCATIGTVGVGFRGVMTPQSHTTPEADDLARTFAKLKAERATHVAMEVSSHALSQGRVLAVRFHVAAFTNLTQDHLDFHGDMASYGAAKAKLFQELAPATSVINVDDPFGATLADSMTSPLLRVSSRTGGDPRADICVKRVVESQAGMVALMGSPAGDIELRSPLIGDHNLQNLAVTLGICSALGVDLSRAVQGLQTEMGAPGRMQRCEGPSDDIAVIVDYAHTPDALARILDAVRRVTAGRVICVFGCGGDRDPTKRTVMGREAGARGDLCIVTNDNPRGESPEAIADSVLAGILSTGQPKLRAEELAGAKSGVVVELDREAAIRLGVLSAAPGDLVLIAGKGHETYQITGDKTVRFSDAERAQQALQIRRSGRGR